MPVPEICACITSREDIEQAVAVRELVSLYEVRIDLVGEGWAEAAAILPHPWIACNRSASQGGSCSSDEDARIHVLTRAVAAGASLVDIEAVSPGAPRFIAENKGRARTIVSHHDFECTADEETLAELVRMERDLGADICKVVTTARSFEDVGTVMRLARRFRGEGVVTFAMGPLGVVSRVLAPLAGAAFTYASLVPGHEAAPGQLTVETLRQLYDAIGVE